jgi:putative transposase
LRASLAIVCAAFLLVGSFAAASARGWYAVLVRSVKEECLDRMVPLGEWHLRRTLHEFARHYHRERNHQGLANELIDRPPAKRPTGAIRRRQRVGGILSYYYRSAA